MNAEFPEHLQFLFEPHRFKGIHGGRGKGGSWGMARAALILGSQRKLRVVCCRETMASLKDSVHALLADQIEALGLQQFYEVQQDVILGRKGTTAAGTRFVFAGLKHNVNNLKSLEACDLAMIEEAESVSEDSWSKLIPSIRKDPANIYAEPHPSEIWLCWNPSLDTAPTHLRFVINPPHDAKIVKLSYRDNPFFPPILELERLDQLARDPAMYRNIWDGEPMSAVHGAVFAAELQAAMDAIPPRITSVPRDRTKPVDIAFDLGYGDKTALWFYQAVDGWYNLIDYLEDAGRSIEWYLVQIQNKGYLQGIDWLPHDGIDTIVHAKLGSGDKRSIEMLMRAAGRNVRIAPKVHVADRINIARTMFPLCRFDQIKCADGLQALRRYQWGPINKNKVTGRDPLHNDASNGADAFQVFTLVAKQPRQPDLPKPPRPQPRPANAWT